MEAEEASIRNEVGYASADDVKAAFDRSPEKHFSVIPSRVD